MKNITGFLLPVLLCLLVASLGCGRGDVPTISKVKGKVVYQGQPVDGAIVKFIPKNDGTTEKSKEGFAVTNSSGEFVLSSYEEGDGAVIGKHTVIVGEEDPAKPLPGVLKKGYELEVVDGENDFTIELESK